MQMKSSPLYGEPMTIEEKSSAVNRINDKYRQIVKAFPEGKNSPEARRMRERMEVAAGENLTKSGFLSRSKSALEALDTNAIYGLEMGESAADLKRSYMEGAKREFDSEKPTKKEIDRYRKQVNKVNDLINKTPDLVSEAVRRYNLHGYKSSPKEWKKAMEAVQKLQNQGADIKNRTAKEVESDFFDDVESVASTIEDNPFTFSKSKKPSIQSPKGRFKADI